MKQEKMLVAGVVGPTASGKTRLGVSLAKRLGGEVLSADSMQVYKGMAVGTAKPTPEEMQGVPHHLLDFMVWHLLSYQAHTGTNHYKQQRKLDGEKHKHLCGILQHRKPTTHT